METAGAVSDLTSEGTHELSQSSVTLVNETTAGEAELFAGVLQEFKKTTVVGMSTKGRGKIQAFYNVTSDGSAIKVSIASLSLLEGGEIEGKGVTPDQTVALTADQESRFEFLTEEDDPQLKNRAVGAEQHDCYAAHDDHHWFGRFHDHDRSAGFLNTADRRLKRRRLLAYPYPVKERRLLRDGKAVGRKREIPSFYCPRFHLLL